MYTKAIQVIYLVLYLTRRGLVTSDHRLWGHSHGGRGRVCVLLWRGRGWAGWLLLFVRFSLWNVVHHAYLCFSVGSPLCLQREEQSEGCRGDPPLSPRCFLHQSYEAQTNDGDTPPSKLQQKHKFTMSSRTERPRTKKQLKIVKQQTRFIISECLVCFVWWWGQTYDITDAPLHININKRWIFQGKNTYKYFWTLRFIDWLKVTIPNVQNTILIVDILCNKKNLKNNTKTQLGLFCQLSATCKQDSSVFVSDNACVLGVSWQLAFPQKWLDDVAALDQGLDARGRRNNPLIVPPNRKWAEREGAVGGFNGFSTGKDSERKNKDRQ